VAVAAEAFDGTARGYLDTATVGLGPRRAFDALAAHGEAWRTGRLDAAACDADVARSRAAAAALLGVTPDAIAVGSHFSPFAALVAGSLRPGDAVLVPEGEFTSLIFPFLVAERRGVTVTAVPFERLLEAIGGRTRLVALSAVQSRDGAALDLDALAMAADHHGADVLLDVTQCAGALPIDATRFAYVAASAYKWLLCPRGTAFLAVRPHALERLTPHAANWYANDDPWDAIYGLPLRLAAAARRLDVSPAWPCWAGAAPALELLVACGVDAIAEHDLRLAARLRAGLGLPPVAGPIVSVRAGGAAARLAAAGVRASARAGGVRLAFHLYNNDHDVDRALEALDGLEVSR
jgi:selenocysteine lyase/cysteine desulfurase